jgi:tight adherence protein B
VSSVIVVVLIVVALATAEAVYYLARFLGERQNEELKRRLRTVGEVDSNVHILRKRRLARSQSINDLLQGLKLAERIEQLIEQTDVDMTVAQVLGYSVAAGLGGALVGGLVLRNPLLAIIALVAFPWVPLVLLINARIKRGKLMSEQLPDALDMMARAVKAGHALPSTFKLIAQECPAPSAVEFAKAYEQQNLGLPFEQAVTNMCTRVPDNLDLRLFAVSINIQRDTGGNLVEVLENIANTMRERFKFFSKLRALTAEGRISGWILGALPFVVGTLIGVLNPGYIGELFTDPLGRGILVGAIVMWSMGILWIRSLMKVEY